jgi:hypothetical protein
MSESSHLSWTGVESVGDIVGAIRDEFRWQSADDRGQILRNSKGSWTSAYSQIRAGDRWHARGQGFESPQLHSFADLSAAAAAIAMPAADKSHDGVMIDACRR